jgi:predicted ATP-binding protein involved in virulence
LATIVSKLLLLEGELRREKRDIEETIEVKDKAIAWHEERAVRLERVNMQLREEVERLRDLHQAERPQRDVDTTIKSVGPYSLETLNEETIC